MNAPTSPASGSRRRRWPAKAVAARQRRNGRPLADDPDFAARLARVEIELANMRTTNLRVVAAVARRRRAGRGSSMLKIRGTLIRQEITALNRRAMGPYARVGDGGTLHGADTPIGPDGADTASAQYFNNRKLSIFGGSNEIRKTSSPR